METHDKKDNESKRDKAKNYTHRERDRVREKEQIYRRSNKEIGG